MELDSERSHREQECWKKNCRQLGGVWWKIRHYYNFSPLLVQTAVGYGDGLFDFPMLVVIVPLPGQHVNRILVMGKIVSAGKAVRWSSLSVQPTLVNCHFSMLLNCFVLFILPIYSHGPVFPMWSLVPPLRECAHPGKWRFCPKVRKRARERETWFRESDCISSSATIRCYWRKKVSQLSIF